ncbi:hypothetical protein Dimus_037362, partial [Dionaea muscipula]
DLINELDGLKISSSSSSLSDPNNPRSFPHSVKQQCWDKADRIKERDQIVGGETHLATLCSASLLGGPVASAMIMTTLFHTPRGDTPREFMLRHGFVRKWMLTQIEYGDTQLKEPCKAYPEVALYNGGLLGDHARNIQLSHAWVMIMDVESSLVKAGLTAESTVYDCIGTVIASQGCWSFLKGGFVLGSPSNLSLLYFQNVDAREVQISLSNPSLQVFTEEQWRLNQEYHINRTWLRSVLVLNGNGAYVAKHCVLRVPTESYLAKFLFMISKTFRRGKRPFDYVVEQDLQELQPLSYGHEASKKPISPSQSTKSITGRGSRLGTSRGVESRSVDRIIRGPNRVPRGRPSWGN